MDATLADPLVGTVLDGRYRVDERIARGGMATVYRGFDERLDRIVAIKVLHPGLAEETENLARFTREAKIAARLSSGNVVSVFDQGTHNGLAFLVMEYVPGRTLRDLIVQRGRLAPGQAIAVLDPVLGALAAAHRAGLVHRDVKPENVLLGDDGSIKVADFGLARAIEESTQTATRGVLFGTVAYLAPEQVATGNADQRTDVYAAGIMLFEMLTGTVPYAGETAVSVAYRHVHEDVPPPSTLAGVPPALDELTVRATRRDPAARPADAGEFLAELRAIRDDLRLPTMPVPVPSAERRTLAARPTVAVPRAAPPVTGPGRAREPIRSRWRGVPVALLTVLLLGLLAAGAGWYLGSGRYTTAPSLTGLPRQQAEQRAHSLGFKVAYADPAYSEVVPAGSVVTQDPRATARMPKGATIRLVLSRGPERHKIPDVRGQPEAKAKAALRAVKLSSDVVRRYDTTARSGVVISQSPAPGLAVRPSTLVTLVVSLGPPPVAVPNLVGANVDDAKQRLADLGLVASVSETFDSTVPKDVVISQRPANGRVARGSTVALTVSQGPPLVVVPDVVGMSLPDARARLEAAGFKVRAVTFLFNSVVLAQNPAAGRKAPEGSTITILR